MPYYHVKDTQLFIDDEGKGVPIIFLHPAGMGRKVFYYQKELAKQFRVIMPDLSGCGDSENPSYIKYGLLSTYAEELVELLNVLGIEKVILCSYSCGGTVAQQFCLLYPERVKGLILTGGFPIVNTKPLQWEHLLGLHFIKKSPSFVSNVISLAHTRDRAFQNELLQHMKKANPSVWHQFYVESYRFNIVHDLHQFSWPILAMYGARYDITSHYHHYYDELTSDVFFIHDAFHELPTLNWRQVNLLITGFIYKHGLQE
ncbi:alpha/beta hydrolase [Priestia endophytica]|uniref:alpha/beta hydrolase n=1 Tax=Priestia endophytica TaxID=135735 RepID=UPI00203B2CA4|nr:alpha/beta hydrolase [Priestia endophytica]MCM3537012.1 alpha/beta hydrolase [Priestia endophytica]